MNKIKRKEKNEKGATGIDIATGAVIFILFTSTIFTLYLQIYKQSALVKIHQDIIGYMVEICEDIDMKSYEETEDLNQYGQQVVSQVNLPTNKYTLTLTEEKYIETNPEAQDLVKKIKISIKYTFDNKEREIQINKIKIKE